jgi:hypothetical protein
MVLLLGTRTYYHQVKREPRIGGGLGTSSPTTLIGTTHTHTRMRAYTCTHARVHIHTYTDTHIQIRTYAHTLYEQVERGEGGVRHGEGHMVHIQHTLAQHTHTHTHTHARTHTHTHTGDTKHS